ncbi:class I SAM-dependent methyltransferase [Nocardia panacis]|uniref:Class I SAM-dependent methyltransferase n=1 Tax=Nocardia panacis TaxID=2340916 RepID=A0A3A4L0H3_9NOCA|nr:methyltransferase domain-containing protein [Nocardia panacis]RJO79905.1 class I SAM-dependent methyltransferase [Nocardia panacis]
MSDDFTQLVTEAAAAPIDGWDFDWLAGRASEQRPSWGYQRLMSERLAKADAALDIQTGGGEVLAGAPKFPPLLAATESWPPNIERATRLLHPRGAVVVAVAPQPPLPFGDDAFDLVLSRHPIAPWWSEIARVLRPSGAYFAQHVGPASVFELVEWFIGPQSPPVRRRRHPDDDVAAAEAAGLRVTDLRVERLRVEFRDIGAVVYFLRKVPWMVPDFTPERYGEALRKMYAEIAENGPFIAYSSRFLIEARKP